MFGFYFKIFLKIKKNRRSATSISFVYKISNYEELNVFDMSTGLRDEFPLIVTINDTQFGGNLFPPIVGPCT